VTRSIISDRTSKGEGNFHCEHAHTATALNNALLCSFSNAAIATNGVNHFEMVAMSTPTATPVAYPHQRKSHQILLNLVDSDHIPPTTLTYRPAQMRQVFLHRQYESRLDQLLLLCRLGRGLCGVPRQLVPPFSSARRSLETPADAKLIPCVLLFPRFRFGWVRMQLDIDDYLLRLRIAVTPCDYAIGGVARSRHPCAAKGTLNPLTIIRLIWINSRDIECLEHTACDTGF